MWPFVLRWGNTVPCYSCEVTRPQLSSYYLWNKQAMLLGLHLRAHGRAMVCCVWGTSVSPHWVWIESRPYLPASLILKCWLNVLYFSRLVYTFAAVLALWATLSDILLLKLESQILLWYRYFEDLNTWVFVCLLFSFWQLRNVRFCLEKQSTRTGSLWVVTSEPEQGYLSFTLK